MQDVQNGNNKKSYLVYKWWKIYGKTRFINKLNVLF